MRRILLIVLLICISKITFAQEILDNNTATTQENVDNDTAIIQESLDNNTTISNEDSAKKETTKKHKKPDFNKKKISLDRIEEKKWSLRVGYNYFFPESQYAQIFTHRLKIGGAYDIGKYLQVQALLHYSEGKKAFNIGGINTSFSGTLYNLGAVVTGMYPMEISVGSILPFASIGGIYTFGNINSSANSKEQKQNIQGGGILAQIGLQYDFNVFSFRVYGEGIYDFTPIKIDHLKGFSGISVGVEAGVKF